MKLLYKIWLDQNGKAFGDGPYELLKRVESTHSLHQAAGQMGMSYSKAWRLIGAMEEKLGFVLIERTVGGLSGGGSQEFSEGERIHDPLYESFEKKRNDPLNTSMKSTSVHLKRRAKNEKPVLAMLFLFLVLTQNADSSPSKRLLIFAGAASKPPTEEAAKIFQEKYSIPVDVVFGGSGFVLSQMKLSGKGDLYFPGSSDFMEIAKREGFVLPETEKIIVYLVSSINVQKGNPKGIRLSEI